MNWDEDIDVFSNKKSSAKFGRRAGHRQESPEEDNSGSLDIPVNVRKAGKWADEGIKSAKKNATNIIEQERFQGRRSSNNSDDDIPEIPDIDDLQEEMMVLQDTKKPIISVNKATYKELDSQLGALAENKGLGNIGNINLSFLTTHLYPEDKLKEEDELWTMEKLAESIGGSMGLEKVTE